MEMTPLDAERTAALWWLMAVAGLAPGAPTAAVIAAHRSYILSGWACVQKYLSVLADNNGVLPVPSNTGVQG